jgi:hypothetical protein
VVTGTNDRFLKKEVALGLTYKYMQNHLFFLPLVTGQGVQVGGRALIPAIRENTDAFMYLEDQYNVGDDPKKEMPPEIASGADLPEIDRSRKVPKSNVVAKNGFQIRVPRSVIRNSSEGAVVELQDDFEFAALWMAELLNTDIKNTMVAGANTTTSHFSPAAVWSDTSNRRPYRDLKNFARDFKSDIFRLTDVIGHENSYYEIGDYVEELDVDQYKQQKLYGLPTVNGDSMTIPGVGDFHNFGTDFADGYLLGLDRNHPAAEYHYYIDEEFSQPRVTYEAMINGEPKNVTVKNLGIHFKTETTSNEDTIMKFWVEKKAIVKKPKGLLYKNGV